MMFTEDVAPETRFRSPLTPRQIEVLDQSSLGFTTRETARILFLSFKTIKNHRSAILTSTRTKRMTHAVRIGFEQGALLPRQAAEFEQASSAHVTERELQLLGLISLGMLHEQIGESLYIARSTVDNQVLSLYQKLGARCAPHAVRLGIEADFIDLSEENLFTTRVS